jgi:hypothetical protein
MAALVELAIDPTELPAVVLRAYQAARAPALPDPGAALRGGEVTRDARPALPTIRLDPEVSGAMVLALLAEAGPWPRHPELRVEALAYGATVRTALAGLGGQTPSGRVRRLFRQLTRRARILLAAAEAVWPAP